MFGRDSATEAPMTTGLEDDLTLQMDPSPFDTEAGVRDLGLADGAERIPEQVGHTPSQAEQGIIARGLARTQKIKELAMQRRAGINRELQPIVSRLSTINIRWREISRRIDERKAKLGRDFIVQIGPVFHWSVLVFLGLGEFPLNAIVFRMFGEAELLTYFMASTLSITIPLGACFIGTMARHLGRKAVSALLMVFMPGSILGAMAAVTYVRKAYISTGGHAAQAAAHSNMMSYSVFALNLVVFAVATLTSYLAHDPDEELDNLRNGIVVIDRRRRPLLMKYSQLAGRHNALQRVAQAKIDAECANTEALVYLYRQENTKARRPAQAPYIFREKPAIHVVPLWDALPENPDDL